MIIPALPTLKGCCKREKMLKKCKCYRKASYLFADFLTLRMKRERKDLNRPLQRRQRHIDEGTGRASQAQHLAGATQRWEMV